MIIPPQKLQDLADFLERSTDSTWPLYHEYNTIL